MIDRKRYYRFLSIFLNKRIKRNSKKGGIHSISRKVFRTILNELTDVLSEWPLEADCMLMSQLQQMHFY